MYSFQKCFSGSTRKRDSRMHARDIQKRGLSCPAPAGTATSTVVSTAIPSTRQVSLYYAIAYF